MTDKENKNVTVEVFTLGEKTKKGADDNGKTKSPYSKQFAELKEDSTDR